MENFFFLLTGFLFLLRLLLFILFLKWLIFIVHILPINVFKTVIKTIVRIFAKIAEIVSSFLIYLIVNKVWIKLLVIEARKCSMSRRKESKCIFLYFILLDYRFFDFFDYCTFRYNISESIVLGY